MSPNEKIALETLAAIGGYFLDRAAGDPARMCEIFDNVLPLLEGNTEHEKLLARYCTTGDGTPADLAAELDATLADAMASVGSKMYH